MGAGRYGASLNWSGAAIRPSAGGAFREIGGRWTVPAAKPPPGAVPPATGEIEYRCSIWIGLDGQRRYRDASLPQIGTLQVVTLRADGSTTHRAEAWTQWWWRRDAEAPAGDPVNLATIPDFPVEAGDDIHCTLTVLDRHRVRFRIVKINAKPSLDRTLDACAPTETLPDGSRRQFAVSGDTAEWILERPAVVEPEIPRDPNQYRLHPFPDHGGATFAECRAVEGFDDDRATEERDLRGARLIRLYEEIHSDPQRTVFVSTPAPIDGASFGVRYMAP